MSRQLYQINLLPWRDKLTKERNELFIVIAAGIVAVCFGLTYVTKLYIERQSSIQDERISFLSTSISNVKKELESISSLDTKKRNLSDRMNIIDTLQRNRPRTVRLFQELVNTLPDSGVWLSTLSTDNDMVIIQGFADTPGRISSYVNLLNRSDLFENPYIIEIKEKPSERAVEFKLTITIITAEEDEEKK